MVKRMIRYYNFYKHKGNRKVGELKPYTVHHNRRTCYVLIANSFSAHAFVLTALSLPLFPKVEWRSAHSSVRAKNNLKKQNKKKHAGYYFEFSAAPMYQLSKYKIITFSWFLQIYNMYQQHLLLEFRLSEFRNSNRWASLFQDEPFFTQKSIKKMKNKISDFKKYKKQGNKISFVAKV